MTQAELLSLLERRGALLTGHFLLSSGLHSDRFIQKFRIFEDPATAEAVGSALADLLRSTNPEVVVSAAVGGVIPGYIVARNLGVRDIFVEKEAGVPTLRRGFALRSGERALIIEDVMTTGKSSAEVARVVESHGAVVAGVGAIVKRGKAVLKYPVTALLDLPLADFQPESCPQCAAGMALEDPGSRRIATLKP